MMSSKLKEPVLKKIAELGVADAAKFFGVSFGTISNWSSGKTSPSLEAVELALFDAGLTIGVPGVLEQSNKLPEGFHVTMWEGRKVLLLLPTYRSVNPKTHFTLFGNYKEYGPSRIGIIPQEGTVIHESRNILIHKAMEVSGAETFIMVDDDMVMPCGNATLFNGNFGAGVPLESASFNAISRLMSHGRDKEIVGCLYYGRHEFGMAQCEMGFTKQHTNKDFRAFKYHGLIPMMWVGTGMIKIERTAIEKMKKAIDEGQFPDCKPERPDLWYGYFSPIRVGIGEDVSFGTRMNKIGVQTYLDADLICLHADGNTLYGPRNTRDKQ